MRRIHFEQHAGTADRYRVSGDDYESTVHDTFEEAMMAAERTPPNRPS